MSACPYCGVEAADVHSEIAHMEAAHPDVIAARRHAPGNFRAAWPQRPLSGRDTDQINGEFPILVDVLGAVPIAALNSQGTQRGVLLDMGGKINKSTERAEVRFLLAPGQVDELIEELVKAKMGLQS